jgi:YVTN family beta-propeller protein
MRIGLSLILSAMFLVCFGQEHLKLRKTIRGGLSPKSVVANPLGLVYAQNMMYKHNVRVYDHTGEFIQEISDKVNLAQFGWKNHTSAQGAPVECVFTHYGDYAWVSNYQMYGTEWNNPGCDACAGSNYDPGVVYRINTQSAQIEQAIKVGSVPKYLCASNDNKWVFVSNWVSGDVSVINTQTNKTERTIKIGRHPRGMVCDSRMRLYVTIMGSDKIAVHDLNTNETKMIKVGKGPRHLQLSKDENYLFCSLNSLGKLVKINLKEMKVVAEVHTGRAPRTMQLSMDGRILYVGNYSSNTISKVDAQSMEVLDNIETNEHPIGLTVNPVDNAIWVACYSGSIMIFDDLIPSLEEENHVGNVITESDLSGIEMDDIFSETSAFFSSNSLAQSLPVTDENKLEEKTNMEELKTPPKDDSNEGSNAARATITSYIIIGSFSVEANATRLAAKNADIGMVAIPSSKNGFTYAAIPVYKGENQGEKLARFKSEFSSGAWIYKP